MVEITLMTLAVIIAVYFILRVILHKMSGIEQANPCQGCSGCSHTAESVHPGSCASDKSNSIGKREK